MPVSLNGRGVGSRPVIPIEREKASIRVSETNTQNSNNTNGEDAKVRIL